MSWCIRFFLPVQWNVGSLHSCKIRPSIKRRRSRVISLKKRRKSLGKNAGIVAKSVTIGTTRVKPIKLLEDAMSKQPFKLAALQQDIFAGTQVANSAAGVYWWQVNTVLKIFLLLLFLRIGQFCQTTKLFLTAFFWLFSFKVRYSRSIYSDNDKNAVR